MYGYGKCTCFSCGKFEAIIRILGKAPLQFLHTLLHVEAGGTEGIAEDIGEKEIDGNAFRLGAATGTEYADDLKI